MNITTDMIVNHAHMTIMMGPTGGTPRERQAWRNGVAEMAEGLLTEFGSPGDVEDKLELLRKVGVTA